MNVTDSNGNSYEYESIGCVELSDVFYEVYAHPHEYFVVVCHEDGPEPSTFEELMKIKSGIIDYRSGHRKWESNCPELGIAILSKLGV